MHKEHMPRVSWTKENILEEAKKFNSKIEWIKKSHSSYNSARKRGLIFEETKHMTGPDFKWTRENILAEALKYNSMTEWVQKSVASYTIARRKGLISEASKHMTGPDFKWSKKNILIEALKYRTKKEWIQRSGSSYNMAKRKGIISEASKHMNPLGTLHKRCLYTIKIPKYNLVYVGITFNYQRRITDHLNSLRFKNLINLYGRDAIISKKETDYLPIKDALERESLLIYQLTKIGFNVLNTTKGGQAGGNRLFWTYDKIIETTKKYTTFRDWVKNERRAYATAIDRGYIKYGFPLYMTRYQR
jgi:predicted GIY-YIG superfamily endonuclease